MEQSSWKLSVAELVKKPPAFYGTRQSVIRDIVYKHLPLIPVQGQMNPVHTLLSCIFKVHLIIKTFLVFQVVHPVSHLRLDGILKTCY